MHRQLKMLRKAILVGDPPFSGGAVLPNASRSTINGVSRAMIGGKVWCASCKTEGFIAKAGGPYRSTYCGEEEALEGDLVICRCPVPPKLQAVAVSSRLPMVLIDDRIESLGALPPPFRRFVNMHPTRRAVRGLAHSIQFKLTNKTTGALLANAPYRISSNHNAEYHGLTDSYGLTELVEYEDSFAVEIEAPYYGDINDSSSIIAGDQYGADYRSC